MKVSVSGVIWTGGHKNVLSHSGGFQLKCQSMQRTGSMRFLLLWILSDFKPCYSFLIRLHKMQTRRCIWSQELKCHASSLKKWSRNECDNSSFSLGLEDVMFPECFEWRVFSKTHFQSLLAAISLIPIRSDLENCCENWKRGLWAFSLLQWTIDSSL